MNEPQTKAGRALLARETYNSRSFPLIIADDILAIENEAAALSENPEPLDPQLLAMAIDIAEDTPILGTGLRRVDVVIREYSRLLIESESPTK